MKDPCLKPRMKLLVLFIPLILGAATFGLYLLSKNLPDLDKDEGTIRSNLKFPRNMDDLHLLASALNTYKNHHFKSVLMLFCCAYIYKQSFAIPGSVFMNILAGAVFDFWLAFPLVCVLTTIGASCCYGLSYYFGRDFIQSYFPDKVTKMRRMINNNMDSLFFFLLFLRIFPMSPNWFLNMVCPIIGVPLHIFAASVFLGLMPYNLICVQTGNILSEIKSTDEIFTWAIVGKLLLIASATLLPGYLIKRYAVRNCVN